MLVNFIFPASMQGYFAPAIAALSARGHEARIFADSYAFMADIDGRARMDVVVAGPDCTIDSDLIRAAPVLRGIVSPVTGTEGFDEQAATDAAVLVANGQIEQNYESMAEATILLILASLYDLKGTESRLRRNDARPGELKARMAKGKTVGLIGFGQIAQAVATRLSAWETKIIAFSRTSRPLPNFVEAVPLDHLLSSSDVVVVLSALNEKTRGLLDAARLEQMKDDVVFINVARGGIVDDLALAAMALRRPAMRLALDVFGVEPLPLDSPLRDLPNTILTPHMIGHTVETHVQLPLTLRDNVLDLLDGRVPKYVRNRMAIPDWLRRFGTEQS